MEANFHRRPLPASFVTKCWGFKVQVDHTGYFLDEEAFNAK
jgi:hypothetical protein